MPAASCRMNPARTRSWWLATCASAGVSLRVGMNERESRTLLPLLLQLAVDRVLELLVRDRAVDEDSVDEERRRPAHPRFLAGLLVGFHQRLHLAAVQALVELRGVEPDLLGVALQVGDRQLLLVAEHLVVQLPELVGPLVRGARSRLRRLGREGMEIEREVAEDELHLAVVLLHQTLDDRRLAPAVRA